MNSGTGSDQQNVVMTEGRVSTKLNLSTKTGNRAEDMLNDRVIDENFRQRVETRMKGIAVLPKNWNDLTIREQRDWIYAQINRKWTNLPKSLTFVEVGSLIIGDCERTDCDERPEWLDHEKFLRGQRFAMDNMGSIFFAQLLALYALYSFENGLKPIIVTGKSSDPFTSFKRYISTGKRVRNWYSTDIWTKDTAGERDIKTVRKMHSMIRERLLNTSLENIDEASKIINPWNPTRVTLLEDFRESCQAAAPQQCPWIFTEEEKFKRPKGLNQGEMSLTQCGFVSLVILYPEWLGIHGSTDDDLDAYCHVWRSVGYLLGIEDEFNFCNGSLEVVKQRSRDFLHYAVKPNLREVTPEWEHMLRCVTEGVRYYFPSVTYEHGLLYLTELLEIPMPRLRASMSYPSWIWYLLMKKTFYLSMRSPRVATMMSRRINTSLDRALNFTDEQLEALKKRSDYTLSKGIAETIETRRTNELTTSIYWHKAPFLVFLSTFFLLNFPIFAKEFASKFFNIDPGSRH